MKMRNQTLTCLMMTMLAAASASAAAGGQHAIGRGVAGDDAVEKSTASSTRWIDGELSRHEFEQMSLWKKIKRRINKGVKIPLSPPGGWKF